MKDIHILIYRHNTKFYGCISKIFFYIEIKVFTDYIISGPLAEKEFPKEEAPYRGAAR